MQVATTAGIAVGEWIALTMGSPSTGTFYNEMNMGLNIGCVDTPYCKYQWAFRYGTGGQGCVTIQGRVHVCLYRESAKVRLGNLEI
jgi:hypothetical protein